MATFNDAALKFEYSFAGIQNELDIFLKFLLSNFTLPKSFSLKSEDGSIEKGDYSMRLPISSAESKNLEKTIKSFETKFSQYIGSCCLDSLSRIVIKLNRNFVYSTVLHEVLTYGNNYGMSTVGRDYNILLISHPFNASTLIDLRTYFIMRHIALILIANGYNVYFPKAFTNYENNFKSNICSFYNCTAECDVSKILNNKIELAVKSQWLIDLKNNELNDAPKLNVDEIVLDCKQFIADEEGTSKHFKNIGYLFVKSNGCITNCMKESTLISHIVMNHTNNLNSVLHIVPENKACLILKAGLLTKMLDDSAPKQNYLVHQGIFKNHSTVSATDYIQEKHKDIKNSLFHKYGSEIINQSEWQSCIDTLVNTEITFDLLLTRSSLPLKINSNFMKNELNDKGGIFVQYNCARLAMLFNHFEKRIEQNHYKPLPNFEDIDFSQLQLEEEWNLFYNYIFPFPSLVKELLDQLIGHKCSVLDVATHKISQMLVRLSRDLSIYYNKIRILVDPHPTLQKKMFARIYLLKSIHQVMKCALALLNLAAVDKM